MAQARRNKKTNKFIPWVCVYNPGAIAKPFRRGLGCIAKLFCISLAAAVYGLPVAAQAQVTAQSQLAAQSQVAARWHDSIQLGSAQKRQPNIAFYYQGQPPVDELQAFDLVVLDPLRASIPDQALAPHTAWLARIDTRRLGASDPKAKAAGSPKSDISSHVQELWRQGYRGFLIDDGSALPAAPAARGQHSRDDSPAAGILVDAIKQQLPNAYVLLRNRLDIAATHASKLSGLVVDSLYHRPGSFGGLTGVVPESERLAILENLVTLRETMAIPIIAIDYCQAFDRQCQRDRAQQLKRDGLQPYVTAPDMGAIGIGNIEVMPRRILVAQALRRDEPLEYSPGGAAIAMPLNYLGYDVRFLDLSTQVLPADITPDRYAGIVVALDGHAPRAAQWRQWLLARIAEGMHVAVVGAFGFPLDDRTAVALGLQPVPGTVRAGGTSRVVSQSQLIGFEAMPAPDARRAIGVVAGSSSQPLLRLDHSGYVHDAAAITPWGGYVLAPYGLLSQDTLSQLRWGFQPLEFFRQALQLPDMPVPDVTSENGRRLMFTQVDGDGFASVAEFSQAAEQYSGQVLHDRILSRYPIPMTISVIEGEMGPTGVHPELAPVLEPVARRIFQLPNVEVASHTYSHPFFLAQVDQVTGERFTPFYQTPEEENDPFSLPIPGYSFNLDREVSGSIDYINQRLAPPDKKVEAILWSGDAIAPASALKKAAQTGVLSINGGNTTITKSNDSWTNIAPYGVARGEGPNEYQVFAAVMNENVYTNDWLGPFYGFERVLETFELTDKPIRFKALDIYYHFYSATKRASIDALETIFKSVMKQPVFPIYTTEYVRRVLQWRHTAVARDGDRWIVRTGPDLRQIRWPAGGVPELSTATGVAGYTAGPGGLYIHMGDSEASFVMTQKTQGSQPSVREASGFIKNFQRRGRNLQFDFGGYYQPFVELDNMQRCEPSIVGGAGKLLRNGTGWRVEVTGKAAKPVTYQTIKVHCE